MTELEQLRAERDAALAQVAALRDVLSKWWDAERSAHRPPDTATGAQEKLGRLYDARRAVKPTLADTQAAADAFVARVRNGALEEAAAAIEPTDPAPKKGDDPAMWEEAKACAAVIRAMKGAT